MAARRSRIQNRLVVAFLVMGIVPMFLAVLVVMMINARWWEAEIQAKVARAADRARQAIAEKRERARAEVLLRREDPDFKEVLPQLAAKVAGDVQPLEVGPDRPIVLWYPGKVPEIDYGSRPSSQRVVAQTTVETFMLLTTVGEPRRSVLVACSVLPVWSGDTVLGNLIAGYELDVSFVQYLENVTGVSAKLDLEPSLGSNKPDDPAQSKFFPASVRKAVLETGKPFRARKLRVNNEPYEAFYEPLFSHKGEVKAILFLGVPKTYTLQAVAATWRFFPVLVGVCGLIAGSLGYTVARHISRPVRQIASAALAVREGDLSHEVEVRSTDEIGDLAAAFNQMIERLRHLKDVEEELRRKDRLAAMGELSAGVAHEIRNPLGIIRSSAQMLERSLDRKERAEELSRFIIEEVDRLNRLVSNFLDFARPQTPRLERIALGPVIDRSIHMAEPAIEKAGMRVVKDIDESAPQIMADAELLSQMFLNLILNAAHATANGGQLSVRLATVAESGSLRGKRRERSRHPGRAGPESAVHKGAVEVIFEDTGCGVPREELSKIFNPFYSRREGGAGLGLSIVHKIAEMHNGQVLVRSEAGKGSIFTVRLPVEPAAVPERRSATQLG